MQQVALNGTEVGAFVVGTADGLRIQFQIDDWQRLNIGAGQRLRARVCQGRPTCDCS